MDRVSAMLMLLLVLFSTILMVLALFAMAPVFCSCLLSLFYTVYIFIANEESGIHHAQEFENRFWTIFSVLLSTALFFAKDSPIAFGRWSPSLGFLGILFSAYLMHLWDRHAHRLELSRQVTLRRNATNTSSLNRLQALGIPVEAQLARINSCLASIDQLLIPSTINNFINLRFVMRKEREIISVFEECDARALNYLIGHVKLGLVFYKVKDHKHFTGQHRTELIQLLAMERLPALTVLSRVIVLHALQGLKLRANPSAEKCVKNILMNTKQDDLSELKTQADAKGVYLDMNKLIFDDIRSETIRQDILGHIQKEAARQRAHVEMGTNKGLLRKMKQWRKVLSDVDDTLTCSAGDYPAGVDKRFGKKVVYPGVLAFYREMDLGTQGPEEWPENRVGNLVFLSARPHLYKDVSEKHSFGKFEKLKKVSGGRRGMHTVPSLLAGDIASGREFILKDNLEPLAEKKFDNFRRYVSIYPEFSHVFVCDNGQGDVRAGELMFDSFPYNFEALYVHVVKDITATHGYAPERWREKGLKPCFFRTYPEAALDAVKRDPPLIRVVGLQRVCKDAVDDFYHLDPKKWPSVRHKYDRLSELNQSIWEANQFLESQNMEPVDLIKAEQQWNIGQQVRTPYGIGVILSFDAEFDMYEVELDWRPLDVQVAEVPQEEKKDKSSSRQRVISRSESAPPSLATVVENEELEEDITSASNQSTEPDLVPETNELQIDKENKLSKIDEASALIDKLDKRPASPKGNFKALDELKDATDKVLKEVKPTEELNLIATAQVDGDMRSQPEIGRQRLKSSTLPKPTARIQGRCISAYKPPKLPKIAEQDRGSLFSFWNYSTEETKKPSFKEGDECTTPYGEGTVAEYRQDSGIVVIDMSNWGARAYLQESDVKVVTKGTFSRLFGKTPKKDTLEFPYAEGTIIKTPFGEGTVVRPIPHPSKKDMPRPKGPASTSTDTIGISLTSWVLADDKHPIVYCTVDAARAWKDMKSEDGTSLFSALGSLVSGLRRLRPEGEKKAIDIAPAPKFQQYYKNGAAVATSFGDGSVRKFRESDGLYEIDLVNWKLTNNACAKAILQKDQISYRIAKGCTEGLPVLTTYGSGTLASVEPTTGVHIVTIASAGMVCYLQPENIIRPLKAAVGEDVLTAYGEGRVVKYRVQDDNYEIKLTWGATLFGKAETFDRVSDSMQDRGWFGSSWLFSLFYGSDNKNNGSQRSRSNSIASLSVRSQSAIDI